MRPLKRQIATNPIAKMGCTSSEGRVRTVAELARNFGKNTALKLGQRLCTKVHNQGRFKCTFCETCVCQISSFRSPKCLLLQPSKKCGAGWNAAAYRSEKLRGC